MSEEPEMAKSPTHEELHDKLKWLMFFRVAVATVLLVVGIIVQFKESGILSASITYTFYPVAGLVFFLSILYIPVLKYAKRPASIANSQALIETRAAIAEGKTIVEPLEKTAVFPSMVVQMIAVGEATGALDTMLGKIAEFYEEEVDVAVDGLTALMEPAIMVVLGTIVGGLIIAMYLPIFSMGSNI